MGGGGKSSTSTQTVSIPPEVLARYNAVNARAESVAQQPFQQYGGEFVAPLTPTQQAGIQATSAASQLAQPYYGAATQGLLGAQQGGANYIGAATGQLGAAQQTGQQYGAAAGQQYGRAANVADPYYQAATGAALLGAQGISPGRLETGRYMNPYVGSVVGATQAALGQQFGQQQAQQQAEAIRAGAFGGDRSGLQRQALRGQQALTAGQVIAPLYQQGYQQALQTAQQQQGVGLSAEQANRAAVQQAGQQLQGIGQGLYGQALGVGQAVQGLGQQQYGQGAQTAQQLAALGQQGYTMGAGSAQQLAGLGTGAQQAALQGAQAQIGAGTLQQQTQQAQDTAQYQQFLQQRGYDFQVAQFLANIAMGTGALSGSTTSTTQPRGFFSNRGGFKTGESLRRSGKAYGGGLDPNSMGGAVYEPGAFERGGYATAGSVVDPTDLSAILAQQRQSFGPFAAAGLYGQAAGATPHGPSGIVPQQQMHVPKLITAGPAPKAPPGAGAELGKVYSLADEATKGLTKKGLTERVGESAFGKSAAPAIEDKSGKILQDAQPATKGFVQEGWDKLFGATPAATGGGIMPRHYYADGGSEDSQADEAIPYDPSDVQGTKDPMEGVLKAGGQKHQMLKPSGGSGGGGGGGGFGDVVNVASKVLPFFLKDGGVVPRQHFDEGGPADAEQPVRKYFDYLTKEKGYEPHVAAGILGNAYYESSGLQPGIVGDQGKSIGLFQFHERGEQPAFRQWASENQRSISDPYAQIDFVHNQLQGPYAGTLEQMRAAKDPSVAAESFMRGYERPKEGPTAALDRRQAYANAIASGEKLPTFRAYAGNQGGLGGAGQEAIQRATSGEGKGLGAGQEQPGFFDRNKGIILPVLQGLGAMASSKSISPWAAALQGLGAGAKAYGDVEQQQATTAQIQEQTSRLKQVQMSGDIIETAAGPMVLMPNGKMMRQGDWVRAQMPPTLSQSRYGAVNAAGAPGSATPSGANLGAAGGEATQAQKYLDSILSPNLPNYQRLAEQNALTASSDKLENLSKQGEEFNPFIGASERAKAARLSYDPTRNLAEALSRYPEGGPVTANVIQPVIDRLDDLFKRAGISVPAIDERASASDVIDKYRTQMGAAAQAAGGSKAYAELQSLMSAIPSKIQSKSGQADLVSAMILANQTPKDEDAALRAYRQYVEQKHGLTPGQSQYAGRGVAQEIESAMQPRISQEKQIIKSMFMNGIKDSKGQDVPIISSVDGTKKPGTLLSYLYQNAGTIPDPKVAEFLHRNYGKDNVNRMLRIFRGGQ